LRLHSDTQFAALGDLVERSGTRRCGKARKRKSGDKKSSGDEKSGNLHVAFLPLWLLLPLDSSGSF
jgi:hypothetical protein